MNAVVDNPLLPAQANPDATSADQDSSMGEHVGFARPRADASTVPEMRNPVFPLPSPRQYREALRTQGEQRGTTVSPVAVEPKADGPRPVPPQAAPAIPHANLGPKVET
jgi:hypothetical protein